MTTITPPFLKSGDFAGIVCTGRYVQSDQIREAVKFFISSGWRVKTGYTVGRKQYQLGGTAEERADDLNRFLSDPEVKAVFVARGGFGHLDIIDMVDVDLLKKQPKWICGFSDVTVLHSHIFRHTNVQTLHCSMPFQYSNEPEVLHSMKGMHSVLTGGKTALRWDLLPEEKNESTEVSGVLIGGNLSVLHCLNGSVSEPEYDNRLLFIEEVDEYLYHIDRMLMCMKRAGKLKNLKGIVTGNFSKIRDHEEPFGADFREILLKHTDDYDYPVVFGMPAGHMPLNEPLVLGAVHKLTVENGIASFERMII